MSDSDEKKKGTDSPTNFLAEASGRIPKVSGPEKDVGTEGGEPKDQGSSAERVAGGAARPRAPKQFIPARRERKQILLRLEVNNADSLNAAAQELKEMSDIRFGASRIIDGLIEKYLSDYVKELKDLIK